ncbi:MAG: MFS transporter [Alphaproteobacteria bacterium]|nr:MFS transporter [Alphaproteobacteria bacterium]
MVRGHMLAAWLERVANVREDEVKALVWAFAYFFCLLTSYYILRPLRDEMGVRSGVENLQWLFSGTFFVMLVAAPIFGAVVSRFSRRQFIPWVYRFFVLNILIFFAMLTLGWAEITVARVFFVWVSVYNLFVVTVFWGFMADLFSNAQGKRLFGFIAAGGSAGALLGPSLTAALAVPLGPVNLLLISAVFLELAVWCVRGLLKSPQGEAHDAGPARENGAAADGASRNEAVIGGGFLDGVVEILRSRYLALIFLHIVLLSTTATFLYFQQASIVAAATQDSGERTQIFAFIDLAASLLTIGVQFLLTGRLILRFGVGPALAFLPVVTMVGFLVLAFSPVLAVVVVFQAIKRAAEFAISNPAREVLFTVVTREQKYKSKSFLDTAVLRGADMVSGWGYHGLRGLGLDLSAIAGVTVPLAAAWAGVTLALGRRQEKLANESTAAVPAQ